jgi:diguanylate cyclase (GGDEF)-like protein/PAS domain S-box-containing protein
VVLYGGQVMSVNAADKKGAWCARIVRWRVALMVAVLAISTVFLACYSAWLGQVNEHRRQFQGRIDTIASSISEQLKHCEIAMEMARGLFLSSDEVTKEEWRMFSTSERFFEQIPGTYGFAYIERVPADGLGAYVASIREQYDPGFDVFDTNLYEPAPYVDYSVIKYHEPIERNASAIGLNVASIPASADAMRRSVLHDQMAVSRKFSLHQTGPSQIGIVLYLPLFETGADTSTPEARSRSVSGWVAMPIIVADFLANSWAFRWSDMDCVLLEDADRGSGGLLFSSPNVAESPELVLQATGETRYQSVVPIGEWDWVLHARDTRPSVPVFCTPVLRVGALGGLIGLLLVLLTWSLARTRDRANELAEVLTGSLKESEQRYALAVHGSNEGLWDWDLTTDKVYYAPRWKELMGLSEDEVGDRPDEWISRITSGCLARFHASLTEHINGETERFDIELEVQHADGATRWMLCRAAAVRGEDRNAIRIAGSLADITDLKYAQNELHSMAHHDQLTGLANRALFTDRLNHAIARAKRNPDYQYAVLFLDFDRFKVINDSLGHSMGDRLLAGMADRILAGVGKADTVARFGGDEFVILMAGVRGVADAQELSTRLLGALSEPFDFDACEVVSTASIGVVEGAGNYRNADEVIRDADTAMYQAKAGGRARYCLFDSQMHSQAVRRMKLEQDLRQSNFDEQFRAYYQPIIDLESGETAGFEALLRWEHPEHGQIQPGEFIEIAEESGLIVELGEWVLVEACKQMVSWRSQFSDALDMSINVNLSRRQLLHADLLKTIQNALDKTGLPASALKLEVTEGTVMDSQCSIVSMMEQIRDLGVRLAMDDFGTGHSSLSCLHQFPIDQLKIDRGFIVNMQEHREFAAVMDAIITLAHFLHLEVVAEGIENADQLAQLQAMDCKFGQGFYFAKPMPPQAATDYLAGYRPSATEAA